MTIGFSLTTLGSVFTAIFAVSNRCVNGVVVLVVKGTSACRAYFNRGQVFQMLDMDDRMLRDIGLTRGDVVSVLSGPLHLDPTTRLRIFAVERRAGNRAQARERLTELRALNLTEIGAPQKSDPIKVAETEKACRIPPL